MGRRGPRPKPTALRELEGDPGRLLPKRKREPKPEKVVGLAPARWLRGYAKAEWRRVVPELERIGLLTVIDVGAFEIYCDTYARWRRARLAKDDALVLKLLPILRNYLGEFGLSPAARVQLHADEPLAPPKTPPPDETPKAHGKVVDARRFFREA